MARRREAPRRSFGSWPSPISAEAIATGSRRFGRIVLDGGDIYWGEQRPAEAGRVVVVRRTAEGRLNDLLPRPFSARSRVHEYGGGAFAVSGDRVFFCNDSDQRIYVCQGDGTPRPLTAAGPVRFADLVVDRERQRLLAVAETHDGGEPANTLVAVGFDGSPRRLAGGRDFFAAPRISPDGRTLAWLSWDHPEMPWDGTTLWSAEFTADGTLATARRIAGGASEAVCQPSWSPDGVLHFVSDRSGWWNLYQVEGGEVSALCPMEAEFGLPMWTFAQSSYAFADRRGIVCAYAVQGRWRLAVLDRESRRIDDLKSEFCAFGSLAVAAGCAVFVAGSVHRPRAIVALDLASGRHEVLRRSTATRLDDNDVSRPRPVVFATSDGATAHAFYYPPTNRRARAPEGERPPLLVTSHGGPTGATCESLDLGVQYWTSRGFALLDVNYRGSTGFGSVYRRLLNGAWGVAEVDDCCNGALWLVAQGLADPKRLAIRGGSAGGFTTLCALTFRDVFRAGASYYGIGDLAALVSDTHKFESHYDQTLIGPPAARARLFQERSPIHHVARLDCPVILFQGLDDKVVPPNQAESMAAGLRAKGLPVAYLAFPGEGHGFRQAETIVRSLEAELYFYGRVFGFTPADTLAPVTIDNLPPGLNSA